MGKLNNVYLFDKSIYFYIAFIYVLTIYKIYEFIKKKRVQYLPLFLIINIIVFSVFLFLLIKYDKGNDRLKSGCLSIILVCIFMLYRAKHDKRGKFINDIIFNQNIWEKTHIYFFPQEFNNQELKIIEIKLKQILDILNSRQFDKKAGVAFLWIKKSRNIITIRLVNQLNYKCEDISENIIFAYENIKNTFNSTLNIRGEIDKKIELHFEILSNEI